jgi:peptidoglycan/LPS O-acetylase OafA/YrhL
MKKEHSSNLESIQFLRGLACFMVMLVHCVGGEYLPEGNIFRSMAERFWVSVEIFFIVSGFIIPYSMYKTGYKIQDFGAFFYKRITRIEPPYIVSIALVLFLNWSSTWSSWYNGPAFHVDWWNVLGHLGYVNVFHMPPNWLNVAYWTLAIEFEYYLLLSLIFPLIISRNRVVVLTTSAVLLLASFINVQGDHALKFMSVFNIRGNHIFSYLQFFVMGIALFQYTIKTISKYEMFAVVGAALSVIYLTGFGKELHQSYITEMLIITCIGTLLCIHYLKRVHKSLILMGAISYSMYLTHGLIITRAMGLMERYTKWLPIGVRLIVCISLCIGLAYIFYRVVEKPFQMLSKKIRYKHRSTPPAKEPELVPEATVEAVTPVVAE